ncbi:MAG TPA: tetratricopeptide repeat protein [Anaeromyxobacteraceae bacterium]|nr:tetratricopeptide repeat protein [Anaeromyxobacteraceae bacterium]
MAAALIGLVTWIYGPVEDFGFINLDDEQYVTHNPAVTRGLTAAGLRWALGFHLSNWHPLTWVSHMLDVELFGLDPGMHHLVSVLLHGLASLLLFGFLRSATGATWRSALVAALFAAHPLHVESVAWVSERKDVLSTVFWFLGCWAYVGWVRRPGAARYAGVASTFLLGLLSKPMVVTLPLVLLLIDAWPLRRLDLGRPPLRQVLALLREKLPLLAMSAASSVVTLLAQSQGGAVSSTGLIGVPDRIGNAVLSYAAYLWKTVWPAHLAVAYPHPSLGPQGLSWWGVAVAALVLAAASAFAHHQRARRPYLAIGWLWYLVTVLPVIGLVQVGVQAMADRYTYVPLVGIFAALAWLAAEMAERFRTPSAVAAGCAVAVLACAGLARRQVGTWKDSFTLFGHATAVTRDNWFALRNLGSAHQDLGEHALAIAAFEESLRLMPHDAQTWMNLGISYGSAGRYEDSARCLERAAAMRPGDDHIWYNLGVLYLLTKQWDRVPDVQARLQQLSPPLAERFARRVATERGQR